MNRSPTGHGFRLEKMPIRKWLLVAFGQYIANSTSTMEANELA